MSPKQRFPVMLEPAQLEALRAIETRSGAPIAEQIRRAISAYLDAQTVVPRAEMKRILQG